MHLPDGIIPINQAIIYWIISIPILIIFLYKFSKDENKQKRIVSTSLLLVASITISSLSIPSPIGVPVHFFVIPLVVIFLGYSTGIIVSFLTLLIQGLFLGMGGITSLGANYIVIGFILSITTYGFYKILLEINEEIAIFGGTVIGIVFATISQLIVLLISEAMNFESLLATLIPFYIFISIIEGITNVIILTTIKQVRPDLR